jgi:hypothetical protein
VKGIEVGREVVAAIVTAVWGCDDVLECFWEVVDTVRGSGVRGEGISSGRRSGGDSEDDIVSCVRMQSAGLRWQIIAGSREYARGIRWVAAAASRERALPLQKTGGNPSWRMLDG